MLGKLKTQIEPQSRARSRKVGSLGARLGQNHGLIQLVPFTSDAIEYFEQFRFLDSIHPLPGVFDFGDNPDLFVSLNDQFPGGHIEHTEVQLDGSILPIKLAGIDEHVVQDLLVQLDVDQNASRPHFLDGPEIASDLAIDVALQVFRLNVPLEQIDKVFKNLEWTFDYFNNGLVFLLLNQSFVKHGRNEELHHHGTAVDNPKSFLLHLKFLLAHLYRLNYRLVFQFFKVHALLFCLSFFIDDRNLLGSSLVNFIAFAGEGEIILLAALGCPHRTEIRFRTCLRFNFSEVVSRFILEMLRDIDYRVQRIHLLMRYCGSHSLLIMGPHFLVLVVYYLVNVLQNYQKGFLRVVGYLLYNNFEMDPVLILERFCRLLD